MARRARRPGRGTGRDGPGEGGGDIPGDLPRPGRGTRSERDAWAWAHRGILTIIFALALVLGLAGGNLLFLLAGAGGLGWLTMVWWRRRYPPR